MIAMALQSSQIKELVLIKVTKKDKKTGIRFS